MACHQVRKVAQGLCGVVCCSDVNVNSASASSVALGSGLAQSSAKLLQGFDVAVVQNRGNHFALVGIVTGDAYILLELPFAAFGVPGANRAVAVAVGGIFNPVGPEEFCGNSCG